MPEVSILPEKRQRHPSFVEKIRMLAGRTTRKEQSVRAVASQEGNPPRQKKVEKKPKSSGNSERHPTGGRPIEQILIGSWNAVQPENQGKAILRVVDRWFTPKYKTEEERKRAAILRPKLEKAVGWVAVGVEAGLIAFGVVKGYQKLRSMDWSRVGKPKRTGEARRAAPSGVQNVVMETIAQSVVPKEVGQAMQDVMVHIAGPKADMERVLVPGLKEELKKIPFSPELRVQMAQDFFQRFFMMLKEHPKRLDAIKQAPWLGGKHDVIRTIMYEVQGKYTAQAMSNAESYRDIPFSEVLNDETVQQFRDYLRVLRNWFIGNGCPGVERFGISLR